MKVEFVIQRGIARKQYLLRSYEVYNDTPLVGDTVIIWDGEAHTWTGQVFSRTWDYGRDTLTVLLSHATKVKTDVEDTYFDEQ